MKASIIGGGVSGLVTGYLLAREGAEVTIYEREGVLGGLAAAFDYDGAKVGRYYHFICPPDAPYLALIDELGLTSRLRWTPTRMGYYYDGRYYRFGTPLALARFGPLSPRSRARFGLAALRARRLADWHALDRITAKEWILETQGRQAYDVVWKTLLVSKFDDHADDASAAWMWARINRVANSRRGPLMREAMGYLEGGTDALVATLAEEIEKRGGTIRTGVAVERIDTEGGRVRGVQVAGKLEPADLVVSTVSAPLFRSITQNLPTDYDERLSEIEYYGISCWALITTESLTPDFWLNVADERIGFCGVITYTNLDPMPELGGRHVLYIPMYMSTSDPRYAATREEGLPELLSALELIKPGFSSKVEAAFLVRDAFAQPIFGSGFHSRFGDVASPSTPVEGLFRIDMSQIYPDDRSIVNAVTKAREVAALVRRRAIDR